MGDDIFQVRARPPSKASKAHSPTGGDWEDAWDRAGQPGDIIDFIASNKWSDLSRGESLQARSRRRVQRRTRTRTSTADSEGSLRAIEADLANLNVSLEEELAGMGVLGKIDAIARRCNMIAAGAAANNQSWKSQRRK